MKRRILYSCLAAHAVFLLISSSLIFWLTPRLLDYWCAFPAGEAGRTSLLEVQNTAVRNICFLLTAIVFLLSLLPLTVGYLKLYRPLSRITAIAAGYSGKKKFAPMTYEKDDELGDLTDALNYLGTAVSNTEDYQRKFISNISHDFRSPLTSIKGYVEAMLDGTIPPQMQEKYLGIVLSETERLSKLTEGLLTLNTFDDRGVYLEMTDFDLVPVILHTVDTFERISGQKNIRIRTSFSQPSFQVHADMGKIQQVLYNLIDNAIKFSYSDSIILIRVTEQKRRVFVSVKDNGEGIAKENLPKIWDRFYKTDASRGRDKKGTGLGLSIVREIIHAHGQNIDVISTEKAGSEFIFTLQKSSDT